MAARIVLEFCLFLTPFMVFGLWLFLNRSAASEGRRKWPINALFLSGLAFAVVGWLAMIVLDRPADNVCQGPSRVVDGKIVPGEKVICAHDNATAGRPLSDDPGSRAEPDNDPT
jgi:Family of unknown function (DUF6111)